MSDPKYYEYNSGEKAGPADIHFSITPSDSVNLTIKPRGIYCESAGTAVLVDEKDVAVSYTLVQGQYLPFRAKRVNNTGTTATVIGWL